MAFNPLSMFRKGTILGNIGAAKEERLQAKRDLEASIAKEKRDEERAIRKEERDAARQLDKEIRARDISIATENRKAGLGTTERLAVATEKVKLFDTNVQGIINNLPPETSISDKTRLERVIASGRSSLSTGGTIDSAFDDIRAVRKDIVTPPGAKAEANLALANPEAFLELQKRKGVAKGQATGVAESFKQAQGIKRAAKKIGSITRQFNEAVPSGKRTPFQQRISGLIDMAGAVTGVKPNPQLGALQKTAKLQLRSILRDMGEGARLSDQDIKQNIDVIEQATLTNEERKALVRTFLQTTVDSMDADTLKVITDDQSSVDLLEEFGVTLDGSADIADFQTTPSGVKFRIIGEG